MTLDGPFAASHISAADRDVLTRHSDILTYFINYKSQVTFHFNNLMPVHGRLPLLGEAGWAASRGLLCMVTLLTLESCFTYNSYNQQKIWMFRHNSVILSRGE